MRGLQVLLYFYITVCSALRYMLNLQMHIYNTAIGVVGLRLCTEGNEGGMDLVRGESDKKLVGRVKMFNFAFQDWKSAFCFHFMPFLVLFKHFQTILCSQTDNF